MDAGRGFGCIEYLTWRNLLERIQKAAPVILPIGAAAKQHGLHLSLNADRIQAEWPANHLAQRIGALVWPTVTYGHYPAFVEYPGSSLSSSVFESFIEEVAAGILGHGVKRLIVLDTGISTQAVIDRVLRRLDANTVLHLRIYDGSRYRLTAAGLAQQPYGGHADEIETSLMLAIAPEVVDMRHAEASPAGRRATSGPLTRVNPDSSNYTSSGSYGDPTFATKAKGEDLLAAMLADLDEAVSTFLGLPAAVELCQRANQ